jgi:hypothetical protein
VENWLYWSQVSEWGGIYHEFFQEDLVMARKTFPRPELNEDQKQLAELIYQRISAAFAAEAREVAEMLASKEMSQMLGATECVTLSIMSLHELGAVALEAGLAARVKKGDLSRS